MKGDLWIGFLAVVLPALVGALGGFSLLRRECARVQADLREGARTRADALANELWKRYSADAGTGLPERVDALARDLSQDAGLATAFVWRKGKGVIWKKGDEQMIIRDMDGSFKWIHEGRRMKYPKRGFFTATGATVAAAVSAVGVAATATGAGSSALGAQAGSAAQAVRERPATRASARVFRFMFICVFLSFFPGKDTMSPSGEQ